VPQHQQHQQHQQQQQQQQQQHHGQWTRLRYAARRVALFDARLGAFPPPLAGLVQALQASIGPQSLPGKPEEGRHNNDDNSNHDDTAVTMPLDINHILINEYTATQGILPHTDGPAYHACTATLSLGSEAVLHFTPGRRGEDRSSPSTTTTTTTTKEDYQVWLPPNSLVVFADQLYRDYQHAIPEACPHERLVEGCCCNGQVGQVVERGALRYSLTFRCKR
jgi:alkylated DNA repair dioxygenase AlkB